MLENTKESPLNAHSIVGPPRQILLATDLSCRCDRALDRAHQLAKQWSAKLLIVHVMEPDRQGNLGGDNQQSRRVSTDLWSTMRKQIRRDLGGDVANVDVRVAEGDPAEQLVAVVEQENCDLIVTGIARNEPFGRLFVGGTVNKLVRKAKVPVLVVTNRSTRAYEKICVATDFSESSRVSLVTAMRFFPNSQITLLHGDNVPFGGYQNIRDIPDHLRTLERMYGTTFLESTPLPNGSRQQISVRIEQGEPESVIWDYVQDQDVDLTVIGSHGKSAMFDMLIGSTTKLLLESIAGDLLIVVDPRSRK